MLQIFHAAQIEHSLGAMLVESFDLIDFPSGHWSLRVARSNFAAAA